MRQFICLSAFLLSWVTIAHGDFVLKQTVENFGQRQQITIKLKGAKCRIDTGSDTSALIDSQAGTVILLNQPKMFMKISPDQLKAQAEAIKKMLSVSGNSNETTDFQANGKTDNISGFATEEYTGKIHGLPVTLDVTKSFPKYRELLQQLYAVQDAPGLSLFHSLSIPPEKYPGLPIRTTVEMLGQKVVTTVDSLEETTLADGDFAIPSDYKELQPNSQPQSSPQPTPR
ncbi:MAG TPA: DUF4412 domain-containing protein [Chthoniobacterales bacterium]|nr:DUF4412 domain-containing protein [Chthoniobacterales bacterium]